VGQTPRSRSAALAATISFASSAEVVDDFPQALVDCVSAPPERPMRISLSSSLLESSRVAERRPRLGRPPSARAEVRMPVVVPRILLSALRVGSWRLVEGRSRSGHPCLTVDRSSLARSVLRSAMSLFSKPVLHAVLEGSWACWRILTIAHSSPSLMPHTRRSCWKLDPLAFVHGWTRHSPGGESSRTVPLSMRPVIPCSRAPLVAKDHTGALFLLIAIFGAALGKGLGDM